MLDKLINKQGKLILFRIIIYPLILAIWSPYRFIQTLCNSKILANGQWSKYNRYRVGNGINSLFYWTQANNIEQYGMNGTSPTLGLGSYKLSRLFHITLPSLFAYRHGAIILPLASMLTWYGVHILSFDAMYSDGVLTLLAFLTILFSTTFFAGAFVFLNYQALGWAFFPLGIWSLENGNYWVAAISWLAVSFTSTTVLFMATFFIAVYSAYHWDLLPLVSFIPAVLKIRSHFEATYVEKGMNISVGRNIYNIARAIGVLGSKAKYKRAKIRDKIDVYFLYYFLLYTQFLIICIYLSVENVYIWITGLLIYLTNKFISRFADEQSIFMLMFTLATIILLQHTSIILIISYWIVASPLPLMLGDGTINEPIDTPPPLAPFKVQNIISRVEEFLQEVQPGKRVLAAFDDPDRSFDKVFNGYRTIHELPLYVASMKNFHYLPDWYAVFDTNYIGAPNLWGRSIDDVIANVRNWKVDYVVIYQESTTELEPIWTDNRFKIVAELDWKSCSVELQGEKPWSSITPKWWLLDCETVRNS